jgi:hypothetical protein
MTPSPLFGATAQKAVKLADAVYSPSPQIRKDEVITSQNTQLTVAEKLVTEFDLVKVDGPDIVLFGVEPQRKIAAKLDEILQEITKGNSPVLFELFDKIKKGVDQADLPSLEKDIREAQNVPFAQRMLQKVGLAKAGAYLQKVTGELQKTLQAKSSSLLDLVKTTEGELQVKVQALVQDASKLSKLSLDFRQNFVDFDVYVDAGDQILALAKARLEEYKVKAQSGDILDVETAKNFEQKVDLFENRLITIKTAMAQAPAELQSISLSQGAALTTLGETATASLQEFNSIKSALIKLSVNLQNQSLQSINNQRRELRDKLAVYGNQTLENVAVGAAKAQGINRLEDAQKLLENATKLREISEKVAKEQQANKQRFAEAQQKLLQSKAMFSV